MLSLAACTGSGGSPTASLPAAAGVRPLSDILASDPQITNVQADSALVRLDTKVPVVCAVVYGTTHDYGQIATDTDMVGGAHTNHHPLLAGLKPDTLYYVRMQGVGPDGTLFRSQEYTFRTPSAQLPTRTGEASSKLNLASLQAGAKVVGVSSNFGGGDNDSAYGANKAIDSNAATQWSSNGDGDKGWIEIELAKKTNVTRVGFWSRTMGSSAQIHTFRIVTDQGEAVGPLKLADADQIYYFDMDSTAKRLRFEAVSTSGGNTGAVEIAVYGDPQN